MENKKKALYVATVVKTHINTFHLPFLEMLKEEGYETHVAAHNDFQQYNEELNIPFCDYFHEIPFERNPFKANNLIAYKNLKKLIDTEKYDIIHCHTPVGGIVCRLAAIKARHNGTKVVYTAHGFHFFKGAPILNWLLYYPIEKICSYFTDALVTINSEDYNLAKKKFKAREVVYIPGVGIDLNKYNPEKYNKDLLREELGIPPNKKVLLSVGELNNNKNHEVVIKAIKDLDVLYIIAGEGKNRNKLEILIKELEIEEKVWLFGYCNNVEKLYALADIFVFPSFREGLSLSLMEAMAFDLPCVVSNVRGNIDLIEDKSCVFNPKDCEELKCKLNFLIKDCRIIDYRKKLSAEFSKDYVLLKMKQLYDSYDVIN